MNLNSSFVAYYIIFSVDFGCINAIMCLPYKCCLYVTSDFFDDVYPTRMGCMC